jgi:hypothetical protein
MSALLKSLVIEGTFATEYIPPIIIRWTVIAGTCIKNITARFTSTITTGWYILIVTDLKRGLRYRDCFLDDIWGLDDCSHHACFHCATVRPGGILISQLGHELTVKLHMTMEHPNSAIVRLDP